MPETARLLEEALILARPRQSQGFVVPKLADARQRLIPDGVHRNR